MQCIICNTECNNGLMYKTKQGLYICQDCYEVEIEEGEEI